MLKKTSAYTGLVIVTAAGALLTSSPAYALDSLVRGSYHHSYHHRSHHRNRNWNGNRHHGRIFIRIYIYNKNNNHAVALARPERRRREVQRDGAGIEAPGGLTAANRTPASLSRDAVADRTPASTEQAPATTGTAPADQNTTAGAPSTTTGAPSGTAGAPSTTTGAPSSTTAQPLDAGATGNVTP